MSALPRAWTAKRYLLISGCGVVGAISAWNFWFIAGGWARQQHIAEAVLWALSSFAGLFATVRAIRRDRDLSWVTAITLPLGLFHVLSALLLSMFVHWWGSGGPRP